MSPLGDASWLRPEQAAASLGVSRQAVQRVVARLEQLGLARRDDVGRWLIDPAAVEDYRQQGFWARERRDGGALEGAEWRAAAESAEIRAALAVAGEQAAEIRRRDERIEQLVREVDRLSGELHRSRAETIAVRREFAGVLALRVTELSRDSLGSPPQT